MKQTSAKLKISDFSIDNYEEVVKLWLAAGLPYKPKGRDKKSEIKKELKRGNAIWLIAKDKEEIIGSILGTHDGRKGWINRVAVHPNYRKSGIAKLLVQETEKRLYKIGIKIIACLIEDWNDTSMKVFTKLGYIKHPDVFYFTKRQNPDV